MKKKVFVKIEKRRREKIFKGRIVIVDVKLIKLFIFTLVVPSTIS